MAREFGSPDIPDGGLPDEELLDTDMGAWLAKHRSDLPSEKRAQLVTAWDEKGEAFREIALAAAKATHALHSLGLLRNESAPLKQGLKED